MTKKIAIIDGSYYFFKSYFQSIYLNRGNNKYNGVYIFINSILKIINDKKYSYIYVALDSKAKTHRSKLFLNYKSQRPPVPESLKLQIPLMIEFLKLFKIDHYSIDGWEGDDIIATIAKKIFKNDNVSSVIFSSDNDLLQLINYKTSMFLVNKKKIINDENFYQNFQLFPNQIIDFKVIAGDPSDNIKGVKGIGKIGAKKLLNKFNDIDNIYKNINLLSLRQKTAFLEFQNKLNKFKQIITLNNELLFDFNLNNCIKNKKFNEKERQILKNFLLKIKSPSLISRLDL